MTTELSIINLILDASFLVQLVMLLLLALSILSWVIIRAKWIMVRDAKISANYFERRFWSGVDLPELYAKIAAKKNRVTGLEAIFESGFREFAHLRKSPGIDPVVTVEGAQRTMRVALNREVDELENHLSFLATVGSISPYIGLFGTVWGIMNSFLALGSVQHASIGSVAPGIAEALIATAMGLFAAIPAVIAYNRYSNDIERLINRYDIFLEEFSTLLQRQAHIS
ncbi:MAG: protein TolQ [Gammaproteobacteria bacterium]|nr:protein TolQ [Gammaproteobacteria bacterium]